ncbi:MAG: T9SS type A sorting domain-containing protein [Saprospiraceae bacterium]|nr:T9SS type A sorting domain-containing protein [Saprospiraceae bacterium]
MINTTAHTFGQQYTITVNGVSDLSGNLISINHNTSEYTVPASNTDDEKIPTEFLLSQNYPNPFNPSTVIKYQLPVTSQISIKVFDLLGNEVSTLVDEFKQAGIYEVQFNTSSSSGELASGVYIYRIQTNEFTETRKMVLLK